MEPIKVAGIIWYTRQNYLTCLAKMADKDKLPTTYDKWRKKADEAERHFAGQGFRVVRLDPEEFFSWCVSRGLNIDAKARMEFSSGAAFAHGRH